jgi:hypothetical protein
MTLFQALFNIIKNILVLWKGNQFPTNMGTFKLIGTNFALLMNVYFKMFPKYIPRMFLWYFICKFLKNNFFLMIQKYVGLYYYVKMHMKNISPKKLILESFWNHLRIHHNVLQLFVSTTFIIFIPNHSTYVHNIFETLLCKHILKVIILTNF